jgi:hypothetical protein
VSCGTYTLRTCGEPSVRSERPRDHELHCRWGWEIGIDEGESVSPAIYVLATRFHVGTINRKDASSPSRHRSSNDPHSRPPSSRLHQTYATCIDFHISVERTVYSADQTDRRDGQVACLIHRRLTRREAQTSVHARPWSRTAGTHGEHAASVLIEPERQAAGNRTASADLRCNQSRRKDRSESTRLPRRWDRTRPQ